MDMRSIVTLWAHGVDVPGVDLIKHDFIHKKKIILNALLRKKPFVFLFSEMLLNHFLGN